MRIERQVAAVEVPMIPLSQRSFKSLRNHCPWSADGRINWFKLLAMAFQLTYGAEPSIKIEKEAAS
jgi:hypothetical protein